MLDFREWVSNIDRWAGLAVQIVITYFRGASSAHNIGVQGIQIRIWCSPTFFSGILQAVKEGFVQRRLYLYHPHVITGNQNTCFNVINIVSNRTLIREGERDLYCTSRLLHPVCSLLQSTVTDSDQNSDHFRSNTEICGHGLETY